MRAQTFVLAVFCLTAIAVATNCTKDQGYPTGPLSAVAADERAVSRTEYPLESVTDPDISGSVTFQKVGGKTKVTIELVGTTVGDSHPAHIHFNSVAEGGGVAAPLTNINGGSGRSVTIVDMAYDSLIVFDGHVNVHLSENDLATYIAQGNIG